MRFCLLLLLAAAPLPVALGSGGGSSEGAPQDYVALDTPIIVNIFTRDTVHFLKLTAEFKLKKPELAAAVKTHLPAIRHDLIMLLSEKRYFELTTVRGKTLLREEALAAAQHVMEQQTGDTSIEQIYFTSLVLQ
jgi:flagellar FliL protein